MDSSILCNFFHTKKEITLIFYVIYFTFVEIRVSARTIIKRSRENFLFFFN